MAGKNEIQIEVLEDGTVSVTTDDLAGPNHVSADKLLKELAEALGGTVQIKKRLRLGHALHVHAHEHGIAHEH